MQLTKNVPVSLDEPTRTMLDNFAKYYQLSRSAVIRLALQEYFEKRNYVSELPHPEGAQPVPVLYKVRGEQ